MDSERWDLLAGLFETARDMDLSARGPYLDQACADAPELRQEIEEMLRAGADGDALEIEATLLEHQGETLSAGSVIGPYRVMRFLAQGGMGEVYVAERIGGAYAQIVALKLLRPGLEATGMLDRFRLERDVLARLTHPAVVPLLDGGLTPEGRHYLVLQYVEGLPITVHCREQALGRRQRLLLFVELCRAVQYAHSNLIVHRDLKPSNILVDGVGEVRLLDFGIAKLLSARPDGGTTRAAELAPMTPERAAPEQLRGGSITTATDVWALGLLLGELVGDPTPTDGERRHVDGSGGRHERRGLPRDLVLIIERALKDPPEERYASAGELADDVERWLSGEPIRARPDSPAYRAGRFIGRYRAIVTVASAAILALATLSTVSMVQSVRAARSSRQAAAEESKAKAVVDLLLETFGTADPQRGAVGDTVSINDLLDQGEERAAALDAQPEVQAALRHALGRIRLERGDFERARTLLETALDAESSRLGEDAVETVPLRIHYSRSLHSTGRREEAVQELRRCLADLEQAPGQDPSVEAAVLQGLGMTVRGEEAIEHLERAMELLRPNRENDPVALADMLTTLAVRSGMTGDSARAQTLFAEALPLMTTALGPDSPRTLSVRSNLAGFLADPVDRAAEHRAVLELRIERLGDHSYPVANSWSHLGRALADLKRHAEAEAAFRSSLAIWADLAGENHPMALRALRNVAESLSRQGKDEAAAATFARLEGRR